MTDYARKKNFYSHKAALYKKLIDKIGYNKFFELSFGSHPILSKLRDMPSEDANKPVKGE